MSSPFANPYRTLLVRGLMAEHKSPARIAEHLPAALADARARKAKVEEELRELADLGWRVDREIDRDRKDVDNSNATIQAHLAAHRHKREAK